MESASDAANTPAVDRRRYRRVVRFFAGAFGQLFLWEVVLRRVLGRRFVARSAPRRWRRIAQRFRALAVELGGLLIKLGQMLSVRVDMLPREVTSELAGLQDEVPPVRLADIRAVIEEEYRQPVSQVFDWFSPEPEAAASLAQVHRARLLTGDEVVVKVQRPRIDETVETDLQAIRTAIRWLKRYRPVRRRVDLDRLYDEFGRTTRNELDFAAEGQHAVQFAQNFAGNPGIRVPRIYGETSTRRVLIMEDVAAIKITDFAAIEAAGISRGDVARRLFDAYLRQVFSHNLVHADPHPGNLFVRPLPSPPDQPAGFQLIFVDFGMVAMVPDRLRAQLQEYLIGFATRDAGRMVRAYQAAGVLLPGADLARLEQVEREMLERYGGYTMKQAEQLLTSEWQKLAYEYRDILYEMPFQLPTDLLFVGRAIAVLFGITTALDPDFDPWQGGIAPFAEQLVAKEVKQGWRELLRELERVTRLAFSLPTQAGQFFQRASQGDLTVRTRWDPESMRAVQRLEAAANRVAGAVIFAALLLAAVFVHITDTGTLSYVLFGLAAVALLATLTRR